jgi:hypothetical protein
VRTIRASEIGAFLYCQRAWWYNKLGHESENLAEMAGGTHLHERHGRNVLATGCLRSLAYALLLAALALLAYSLTSSLL